MMYKICLSCDVESKELFIRLGLQTRKVGSIMYYIVFLENEETGKLYTKKVKEFDMVEKFMKKPNYIAFLPASVWESRGLDK